MLDFFYPMDPFSHYVAGVDEVGRGPLVGNVVTAAVILDPARPIEGLNDSKKLSEKKREALSSVILENALAWAIGEATPEEIDRYNILQATMLAMTRAVDALKTTPEFVLVDGNRLPKWNYPSEAVVKGDARVPRFTAIVRWWSLTECFLSTDLPNTKDILPPSIWRLSADMVSMSTTEKVTNRWP